LQTHELSAAQLTGPLQRQQHLFDVVENDIIPRKPGDIVRESIRRRGHVMDMVLPRHVTDDALCRRLALGHRSLLENNIAIQPLKIH
jgi:hypothetical protein